jgi:hypothetical protein
VSLGFLFLIISISIVFLWTVAFFQADTHEEKVSIFLSFFPTGVQNSASTNWFGIILSLLGIILSRDGLLLKAKIWKFISIGIMTISGIMLLIFIWWML